MIADYFALRRLGVQPNIAWEHAMWFNRSALTSAASSVDLTSTER